MDAIVTEADRLQEAGKVHELYDLLKGARGSHASSPEFVWRYARACYLLGEEKDDKQWKKDHFEEGLAEARRCVELDPKNGLGHKWVGILLGRMGDFVPIKEKISNAFLIKESFQRALDNYPKDPTAWHCMGQWCSTVASVGWLERQAASLLFATPPQATYEEAEANYLKAMELNPTFVDSSFALGELYQAMKRVEEAKVWYQKCATMPSNYNREQRLQTEASKRAASL
eukprot:TRINITY_DN1107_c0_g1_i1.p1 TRINITY_DN1107_c0_g1~~TRINITY_DN1107_c0_g1_i1.p1  ORF type:complete len:229 (+),score=23.89 TRINITY_DN1107_c0_g1_i1:18-704(+)